MIQNIFFSIQDANLTEITETTKDATEANFKTTKLLEIARNNIEMPLKVFIHLDLLELSAVTEFSYNPTMLSGKKT